MPIQSSLANREKGLCLLSLDAGGSRSISQLAILAKLMHSLSYDSNGNRMEQPCRVFDMICGVGSGG
ncbi:hypothetical protein M408DRAFT_30505 [Serendipita vermifera MAFF 305830]|uniref:PNPLA domain-containing protein n=1 Tax=Serendipita vermifera MAFF 305830 TaxID=933852 RepID=A0A0C3ALW8_SERVB|nr:hypothetical protein M408DRAFT_30505 [Serendipita vermifera MAFF 305830]